MADQSQLKLLINLARIDGQIADDEIKYLKNIGKAHNIDTNQIMLMLQSNHDEKLKINMNDEERLDLLINLVQLMKCDGKLYKEEIKYCSKIASRLGFKEEVMFELMLTVKSGTMKSDTVTELRNETKKYLKEQ